MPENVPSPRDVEMSRRIDRAFVPKPDVSGRLRDALGLLEAIDHGELLVAAPIDAADRARHETGLSLLAVLARELERLLAEVRVHEELTGAGSLDLAALGLRSSPFGE